MCAMRMSAQAAESIVCRKTGNGRSEPVKRRQSGAAGHNCARLRPFPKPSARRKLEFEVEGRPEIMCQIRSKVAQFASAMDLTSAQVADIKLAVGEAVTNAVKHGSNNGRCTVSVAARKCRDTFLVRISDHGLGFDPATIVEAGCSLDESGRGIMCMKAVMDEVRIRSGKHGTEVTLIKKLR